MIRQSIVDRLQGATERLQAALIAGEDTLPHRNVIERLEADITKLDTEERQAEAAAVAKAATDQAELATSIAQNAIDGITAILAKHPVPTLHSEENMTNSAVISAAKDLAATQTKYEAALRFYTEASSRTASIRSRLSDVEAAAKSILEQRSSGQLNDREAAGLIVLNHEDQSDLRNLLAVAEREQEQLNPIAAPVRAAQEALDHATKAALFQALAKSAKEAEAALLAVVTDLYETGCAMGKSPMLGSSWIPSRELSNLISFNQVPRKPHAQGSTR